MGARRSPYPTLPLDLPLALSYCSTLLAVTVTISLSSAVYNISTLVTLHFTDTCYHGHG